MKILSFYVVQHKNMLYFCNVFFMVLDLRLTKRLGCRETTFLVLYKLLHSPTLNCKLTKVSRNSKRQMI